MLPGVSSSIHNIFPFYFSSHCCSGVPKVWQAGRLGLLQSPGLCLTAWFWLRAGKGSGSLSERDLNPTVGLMVDAVWSSSTESFFSCVTNYIFFLLHSLYCLITIRWVMGAWVGKGSLGEIELSKYYHHTDPLSLTGRRLSFFFFIWWQKFYLRVRDSQSAINASEVATP